MIEINYKSIAPFYDIAASEKEDAKLWKGLIKEIKHQKNQPLIIYELGIGTGRVLEQLLDELTPEDKYIGIDISKELLSILERKIKRWCTEIGTLPKIEIWSQDMRELTNKIEPKADLIICPYSTLQHLTWNERKDLYKIVYSILNSKGIFVFDDSTPSLSKIKANSNVIKLWIGPVLIYFDKGLNCYQIVRSPNTSEKYLYTLSYVSTWDEVKKCQKFTWITEYWNNSNFHRIIQIHYYYPIPPLQTVLDLSKVGFINIEVWTGYGRKSQINWETEGTIIIKAVKGGINVK